jgi:hypothetical protein
LARCLRGTTFVLLHVSIYRHQLELISAGEFTVTDTKEGASPGRETDDDLGWAHRFTHRANPVATIDAQADE